MNRKVPCCPHSTFTLRPDTTDDKGTRRAALALALLSEAVEGQPERMKHVKRQSPSPISGEGLCKAFLTKEQLWGVDKQHLRWAPSGSKQEKWAKMERVGRNGMSAPQIVVVNHEAPRSCPSFRNHL